jgi:hypothetical protein
MEQPQLQASWKMKLFFEGDRLEPDFSDVPGQWELFGLLMEVLIIN